LRLPQPPSFLAALVGGCATALEYPKAGQAWGQIVEETLAARIHLDSSLRTIMSSGGRI